MKLAWAILVVLALPVPAQAQEETLATAELVGSVNAWMRENVDDWVFDMTGLDREAVSDALVETQTALESSATNSTQQAANDTMKLLGTLEQYEETQPYADWLRSLLGNPMPEPSTSPPPHSPVAIATPTATPPQFPSDARREQWIRILSGRSVPVAASEHVRELTPIFVEEGVPAELVWLAEVESGFNPDARSPVGAVGLFQLMPDTADSLGLSLWPFDQRKQPLKSARAAAGYLRYLHDRFGDWQLALAAYNGGETRVARLLSKSGPRTYAAIADRLPAETQDYVPKVEATIWAREGVRVSDLMTAQK